RPTGPECLAAPRAPPRCQRRLQHLPRLARVTQDQHLRALGPRVARRCARQRERQLGAEQLAGDAADAVGPEQLAGHAPPVPGALALGELRPLARLLQACLLALLGARIARQEAPALELAAQVGIGLEQRARDA